MKKINLEVITAIVSVAVLIVLIMLSRLLFPASAGYGYTAALLIFIFMMFIAGLKLAEIPDK